MRILKSRRWKVLTWLTVFALLAVMSSIFAIGTPALAGTTADVTVTAQGAFVSWTANETAINFGLVVAGSTNNTTGDKIKFTNASTVTTNISCNVTANAWTSTGVGWTHSDTAAGANTAAMKVNTTNGTWDDTTVFIKYTAPYNQVGGNFGVGGTTVTTGISLLAPTSFTDGKSNEITVRFSFYSSS